MPNHPAEGKAGIALQLPIGRRWPGLPVRVVRRSSTNSSCMKKRFGSLLVVFAVSASVFAGATHFADRLLDHLVGRWVLSGTIAGKSTTHDVSAERVLQDGYVRIHEVSREVNSNGAPAYEAIVFISFDPTSGSRR